MILLLDTNVVIDVLTKRDGFEASLDVMRYCEVKAVKGYVTAVSVTDIMYILRKYIEPAQVRDAVKTMLAIVDVAGVVKGDIMKAFSSDMRDFEDAVQASCAKRIKADYVVTRNLRDFEASPVPAISPADLIVKLKKQYH